MIDFASDEPDVLLCPAASGPMFDLRCDQHPTTVSSWNESDLILDAPGTHFGFVHTGQAALSADSGTFQLSAGMYFAVPGGGQVRGSGAGFVATHVDYRGLFQIGGPIEPTGRLRYIDGCTDTLLLGPVMQGDPCLNLLHIPPETRQTAHTHPSLRVGMVAAGNGVCRTVDEELPLTPGLVFVIRSERLHSFHTYEEPLVIVAWHPDSDFGPTHEQHPMLNRTLVDGRPIKATGEPR